MHGARWDSGIHSIDISAQTPDANHKEMESTVILLASAPVHRLEHSQEWSLSDITTTRGTYVQRNPSVQVQTCHYIRPFCNRLSYRPNSTCRVRTRCFGNGNEQSTNAEGNNGNCEGHQAYSNKLGSKKDEMRSWNFLVSSNMSLFKDATSTNAGRNQDCPLAEPRISKKDCQMSCFRERNCLLNVLYYFMF